MFKLLVALLFIGSTRGEIIEGEYCGVMGVSFTNYNFTASSPVAGPGTSSLLQLVLLVDVDDHSIFTLQAIP
jgi:hypothetical protein